MAEKTDDCHKADCGEHEAANAMIYQHPQNSQRRAGHGHLRDVGQEISERGIDAPLSALSLKHVEVDAGKLWPHWVLMPEVGIHGHRKEEREYARQEAGLDEGCECDRGTG